MLSTRRRYYITPILKLQVFFVILLFLLNRKTECELINVSFSAHHFYAACQYLGKEMEQQLSPHSVENTWLEAAWENRQMPTLKARRSDSAGFLLW